MTFLSKIEQAKQLIKEYAKKYPKCAVAISGGKDSGVLFYLIREVASQVPSFTVLSNTEFPETIQTIIKMAPQTHFYYFKNDPKKGSEVSCSKCSAKEEDEKETERAGRWRGTKNAGFECGIHSVSLKDLPNKAKEINGRQ